MSSTNAPPYAPYRNCAANDIYNLLFCDDTSACGSGEHQRSVAWQTTLFAERADEAALLALASDTAEEGRIRYLAYARLRALAREVPGKVLLGVIVEVPLADGLDALAAYADGGVRYINHTEHISVFEGAAPLAPHVGALFAASEPVVARIGPWDGPRKPPPAADNVRLSFLVSCGLCFGEGPMSVMQRDAMAGPIIQRATALLQAVVAMTAK